MATWFQPYYLSDPYDLIKNYYRFAHGCAREKMKLFFTFAVMNQKHK
jgi:hypothetical protein